MRGPVPQLAKETPEVYNLNSKRKLNRLRQAELLRAEKRLAEIRGALCDAYSCFDAIADPELTDACIFEINALRARYNNEIRQIKSIGG